MINRSLKSSIFILAFIAILIVTLLNVFYISNISMGEVSSSEYLGLEKAVITFIIICEVCILCYLANKIKIPKTLKIILIILSIILYAVIQIMWINTSLMTPRADSKEILEIAKCITGNTKWTQDIFNYIEYYPQQLTLATIIAIIFKIFNTTDYILIQYINVIFNIFTFLGLYFILKKLSKKHEINEVLFFMLTLTFIPLIMLVTYVYGDIMGLALSIWGVYFAIKYVETNKIRYAIITALLLSFSYLLRMNYIIFFIAIIIYWIINYIDIKKEKIKQTIKILFVTILSILIILIPSKLIKDAFFKEHNLSKENSFSIVPYLYMGMSESETGNGWYSIEIENIVQKIINSNTEQSNQIKEETRELLNERVEYLIQNPIYAINFYKNKLISTWAEPSMAYNFYNKLYEGDINKEENPVLYSMLYGEIYEETKLYQKALNLIIFAGTLITIFQNRKKLDKEIMLLCLIFLGGFGFHLLWETKSRYILPYVIIIIPVACIGITNLFNKLTEKLKKDKLDIELK